MRNTKKFIISLIFFLLLCSTASAFEDTVERYPTGVYTDYWTKSLGSNGFETINVIGYPASSTNHVFAFNASKTTTWASGSLATNSYNFTTYLSFVVKDMEISCVNGAGSPTTGGRARLYVILMTPSPVTSTTITCIDVNPAQAYSLTNSTIEIVASGNRLYLYKNGISMGDVGAAPTKACKIELTFATEATTSAQVSGHIYIDDISTDGSLIGVPETFNEYSETLSATYNIQAYQSYPSSTYQISMYRLSGENPGKLTTDNITSQSGMLTYTKTQYDEDFGLYLLELTRDSDILYDQYMYYYQNAYPVALPDILWKTESDVSTEIRDEDNNGGELDGGGSVYLYPDIQADGTYNFTYDILETPYSIKTELTNVYNNTAINSTTLSYSGLSTQKYNVSIDGAYAASTDGVDTYSHIFSDWGTATNHIISFAVDYSKAGVWGEVKNSETQEGIRSATVSISGENFSKTIYTDENGLYYLTKGMEAGKTYTITVSKTGYTTPPSQTAFTTDGSTTRQDFYMDKTSSDGSGLYYAPHDVGFTVLEYWYSGAGLTGVNYAIYNGTESIKTGITDSKGMFTGPDMSGGTNYTIILTYDGKTYTEYVEPSQTEYTFVLNKEGILHQYVNSWLNLTYTENTNNVTIAYNSNKTITGASLTAIAGNGTTVYTQTLNTDSGTFTFETGGEGDYTLNFHIQATDGSTASQSWGLSYPNKIPLFPDSYPAWLKNVLFSGIVMIFLLAFGKSKNDIACGAVAILTSMGYIFEWFTGSFYFVVLVWIIALGAVFLHYKRTGGIG